MPNCCSLRYYHFVREKERKVRKPSFFLVFTCLTLQNCVSFESLIGEGDTTGLILSDSSQRRQRWYRVKRVIKWVKLSHAQIRIVSDVVNSKRGVPIEGLEKLIFQWHFIFIFPVILRCFQTSEIYVEKIFLAEFWMKFSLNPMNIWILTTTDWGTQKFWGTADMLFVSVSGFKTLFNRL